MTSEVLYQWLWVFFIYAFLGWCVEVIFHAFSEGKFINRGFLNGPICPIYGFGVLTVVLCLEPIKGNLFFLFLGSIILTSFLELITGFILERFFNDKWWDYSKQPFNLHGYICLGFSLIWGLACILIVEVVYPLTEIFIDLVPVTLGTRILGALFVLTLTDAVITLTEALKLKKKLIILSNAEKGLRKVYGSIGAVLAEGTLNAIDKFEKRKEVVELKKDNAKKNLSIVQSRILNSYPRLKYGRYQDSISKLTLHLKRELPITDIYPALPDSPKSIIENLPIALYRNTFETIIDVLEARDEYTAGHSRRVAYLTHRFCKVLKIPMLESEMIEMAASVHDIGKVGVPDATLNKRDKLNDFEWEQMRKHPDIGADIIMKCDKLSNIAEIIRHHHEHWDGSGYPKGLKGNEIPKGAQIISICDAVDSMMIARVFRAAVSTDECVNEIKNSKGSSFCPELVDKFTENWKYIVSNLYNQDK